MKSNIGAGFIRALLLLPLLGLHPAGVTASDELILELRPEKNRAYLHEAVPVTVTLLAGAVSPRNIQYPRLDGAAFRSTEFAPPRQTAVIRDGREFTAHEFSATLIPRKPGEVELGPAELSCDLLAPAGGAAAFFGGGEPRGVTLRSQPVRFTVLPLPTRGRPADFGGAVGRFTVSRQATPTAIRSGDPVTVTTRIEGVGNIDSFSCPAIALPGVHAYPPRARRTGKRLSCEQVLLPEGRVEIPAARISFFDPLRERYQTRRSGPIGLEVVAAPAAAALAARTPPAANREKPAAARLPWFAAAAGALILAALGFLARRRTRREEPAAPAAVPVAAAAPVAAWLAESERALTANDPETFHTAVFRALQAHLGGRHGLPATAITGEIVARVLRPAGVEARQMEACANLFNICDRARYAPGGAGEAGMRETLRLLLEVATTG